MELLPPLSIMKVKGMVIMRNKLVFLGKKYSLPKLLIAGIILDLVYTVAGLINFKASPIAFNRGIYALVALIITGFCAYFSKTTKVLNVHVKQGKLGIYTAVIVVCTLIIYAVKASGWLEVFKQTPNDILICIFTALAAGFCEEFLFRNLFFNFFIGVYKNTKHILFWTSITSTLFFALMHLVNLWHQSVNITLEQVVAVFGTGIIFCVFHILFNSMWVPVLLHFLWDFSPIIKNGVSEGSKWSIVLTFVAIVLILFLSWLWLFEMKVRRES